MHYRACDMQVFLKNIAMFMHVFSVTAWPTWISRVLGLPQATLFNHIFQFRHFGQYVVH